MALPSEHLGGQVGRRAAEAAGLGVVHHADFRQAKVCQQSMTIFVENDVVWLQVSKDDVLRVEVLEGKHNLSCVNSH